MTLGIPLRCRCGTVRGQVSDVSADDGKRAICYCDDCQIYALHLGREDILDARGGTEALLTTPAQLTLTEGTSALRGVRLSARGPYRWYARCCNTPVGNSLTPGIPVLILPTAALDLAAIGKSADDALGRVNTRMWGRFAKGGVPEGAHAKAPLSLLPRLISHVGRGFIKRLAKPSPFFDERGLPRAELQFIDKTEREALRARVLAAADPTRVTDQH